MNGVGYPERWISFVSVTRRKVAVEKRGGLVFLSNTTRGRAMSKSKHSNKIVEDHDGTFYCLKCGQAGFKTKSAGYGHLTTCKGYKSAVNKITKELKELGLKELGLNPASSKIETNQLDEAVNMNADSNRSLSAHISHEALESGPPVGHPRATLGPPSGSPYLVPDKIKIELMRLKTQNEVLQKIAFNHNQHYPHARQQNFSGPQDMVNSTFGELMDHKAIRLIVTFGALAVVLNFVMDQFDKLNKRSKNRKK